MNIGVFDSGFGGIDILKHIVEMLPQYNYIYLGDSKNAPYGTQSQQEIENHVTKGVRFLFEQECVLVIFACNTASTQVLRTIQQEMIPNHYPDRNALGVIIPACEEATTKGENIGVLATQSSVDSGSFIKEIQKLKSDAQVFQQAAPRLVELVEEGNQDTQVIEKTLTEYLQPLVDKDIDTLILGCTHFGLLEAHARSVLEQLGSSAEIIHEGRVVADKLEQYLKNHPEYEAQLSQDNTVQFLTTGKADIFKTIGSNYFDSEIDPIVVDLD